MNITRPGIRILSVALLLVTSFPARADEDMILVGEASYRYLFWQVYDARLYAPTTDFRHFQTRPFALSLEYQRQFSSRQIVDATGRQFRESGFDDEDRIAQWLEQLLAIIPDVSKGDVIRLDVDRDQHSHFYFNGRHIGSIENTDFSRYFSGIWLSAQSSDPQFTSRLLGEDR